MSQRGKEGYAKMDSVRGYQCAAFLRSILRLLARLPFWSYLASQKTGLLRYALPALHTVPKEKIKGLVPTPSHTPEGAQLGVG